MHVTLFLTLLTLFTVHVDAYTLTGDVSAEFTGRQRYLEDTNLAAPWDLLNRSKRQAAGGREEYFVTQCRHDNLQPPTDVPSISVLGTGCIYPEATLLAAQHIHRMVRFMPRDIFRRLSADAAVGLYNISTLPGNVFEEFYLSMPIECAASCRIVEYSNGSTYDCSRWCTTSDYPYNTAGYPLNYLWAYGNFSRTYVVENNIVCRGFNPSGGTENDLIREFGLTVMTRALDTKTLRQIGVAYANAVSNGTFTDLINVYDYFMKGTLAWFDGVLRKDLGGMACTSIFDNTGLPLCETGYQQRQYIGILDPSLYSVLNYVYNNNRHYVEGETFTCPAF
ncbi:uncharacterized protein LOC128208433 [Mya arenaria]|uniref:uncharacterized protein LOC128208433 n=1 Tax=Mya arenaria TaxID=6604 RepID=UPI0022E0CCF5|nr:uncharacterized protein LOC128208433 [Mya arenaria]